MTEVTEVYQLIITSNNVKFKHVTFRGGDRGRL